MKKIVLLVTALTISACTPHDEAYYRHHPEALKPALAKCSDAPKNDLNCSALEAIAMDMNQYIYELQTGPQDFGRTILSLQTTIAKQKQQLKLEPENQELKTHLKANIQTLSERLAVVRWLESPAS